MIVELAQLTIVAGREAEFEAAFRTAITASAAAVDISCINCVPLAERSAG